MASAQTTTFETGHSEMIHDAQLDYYGKKLATASSDCTIKLFDVTPGKQQLVGELKGHEGPVWQVAWAHPKFGNLLASCSYDAKVVVWKETAQNQWNQIYENASRSSVNAVAWAPHTFGLVLAAACADGTVSVFTHNESDNKWDKKTFSAHKGGCNSVSWGPDMKTGSLLANQAGDGQQQQRDFAKRFVTAGCDNSIRIWRYDEQQGQWFEQNCFVDNKNSHSDWVRDAAWAPSLGLPSNTIASCSEDQSVMLWTEDPNGQWKCSKTLRFNSKVWRVSWSIMGNILAITQGNNKVSLWKESVDGEWQELSSSVGQDAATGPPGGMLPDHKAQAQINQDLAAAGLF